MIIIETGSVIFSGDSKNTGEMKILIPMFK
jgi:hypothetical protein